MRAHLFWRLVCWLKGLLPLPDEGKEMLRLVEYVFSEHNNGWMCPERRNWYRGLKWVVMKVPLRDIGVWDRAQGMPHEWCMGNVLDTAELYKKNGDLGGYYTEKIQRVLDEEADGVILVDGRLKRGREKCLETTWSIDDGCMRALASALRGETHISCYAGRI